MEKPARGHPGGFFRLWRRVNQIPIQRSTGSPRVACPTSTVFQTRSKCGLEPETRLAFTAMLR
jgi:hypothetical protein